MAKDVRIIPASGEINFNENGLEKATVYQLGNDIHIAPIGTIYLGDGTAANLQLGDEATSVDIQFLGGGTITSTGGTLSIGSIGDVVNLNEAGVTYNLPQINAQSLQGYVPSNFALATHTHTISNVTGLQTALDGKQPVGSYLTGIADNSINALQLNVSGNGTTAQYLRSDGDGTFTWATPTDTNTTYSVFTSTVNGLAPLSGGGTTKYLRADGTWVVPPDTDTNTTYLAGTALSLTGTTFSVTDNAIGATQLNVSGNGTTAQYLRSDGDGSFTWATPTDTNTTYSQATASVLGLIKLGDATAQTVAANTVTATASRTYAVQVNGSGQAVVNVPWVDTDTNTTYSVFTSTANGLAPLSGGGTTKYLRADGTWVVPPDTNTTYSQATSAALGLIKLEDDTVQTVAANTVTTTASRTYGIQVNSSGQAVVNVPWVDTNTNTTYTAGTGLTLSGTVFSVTANGIGATQLNVTGNGTTAQYLRSDADGSFTWATPTDTNTTYTAGTGLALTGTVFSLMAGGLDTDIDIPGVGMLTFSKGLLVGFAPA